MKYFILTGGLLIAISTVALSNTTATNPSDNIVNTAPDNSAVNAREQMTAEDQSTHPRDAELTRKIRQELTKDNTLSTYAQNVKIVTRDGRVTLIGPVETAAEKAKVEAKAARVAGRAKIKSELEISGQ